MSLSCFGAAAIALLGATVAPGVGAQSVASRPKIFSTASDATGVEYFPDQEGGLTPIKDTFRAQFVTGTSTMSATNGPTARATVVDPGNGATQGPANACPVVPTVPAGIAQGISDGGGAFIGDPLLGALAASNGELKPVFDACTSAKWPFAAQADGFTPDKRTEGAIVFGEPNGQLNGDGGGAHAVINDDGTSQTDATMSGLRIAPVPGGGATGFPLPPTVPALTSDPPIDTSVFTAGSIQSTTANFFDGGAAVSHSESRLNGVRLVGGLVTIDSITSIAESRFGTGADPVGASSTTVQGVRYLGQPATIDDKGIHPEGSPADDDSFNNALNDAGLSVRLVGATQGIDDSGFMTATARGVVVDFIRDVNTGLSLPSPPANPVGIDTSPSLDGAYFVRYFLASVSTRSFSRNLNPITRPSGTGGTGGTASFSTGLPAGAATPSGFTGGTKAEPAPALDTSGVDTAPIFFGLTFDLRWLYLAFTLAAFGMCLAPRLLLPARLPGQMKG